VKIAEYNQMMKYLTRPAEPEYEQLAMAGAIKGGKKLVEKLVKKGKAPKTDVEKVKDQTDPSLLTTEELIEFRKTNRAGKGQFTNAEAIIARLENTIRDIKPDDETYEYVTTTFPNFIRELKANPKLAENDNVFNKLMGELPDDQRFIRYDDGTVDFQTKKPSRQFKLREDLDTDRKGPTTSDKKPGMFDDIFDKMYKDFEDTVPGEQPLTKKKRTLNAEGGVIGEDGMFKGDDLGTREGFRTLLTEEEYIANEEAWKKANPDLNFESLSQQQKNQVRRGNINVGRGKQFSNLQKIVSGPEYDKGAQYYGYKDYKDLISKESPNSKNAKLIKQNISRNEGVFFDPSQSRIRSGKTRKIKFTDDQIKALKKAGFDSEKLNSKERLAFRRMFEKTKGKVNLDVYKKNLFTGVAEMMSLIASGLNEKDFEEKELKKAYETGRQKAIKFKQKNYRLEHGLGRALAQEVGAPKDAYLRISSIVPKELNDFKNAIWDKKSAKLVKKINSEKNLDKKKKLFQELTDLKISANKKLGGMLDDFSLDLLDGKVRSSFLFPVPRFDQLEEEDILNLKSRGDTFAKKSSLKQFQSNIPVDNILRDTVRGKELAANPIMNMLKVGAPTLPAIFGPTGVLGLTYAFRPEGGYDLKRPEDRITFGLEAALAPTTVKGTSKAASYLAGGNQPLRRGLERAINLGMRAAPALRAARVLSPLGLLSLAGEAGYYTYKKAQETQAAIDAMTPYQRELYESQMQGEALGTELGFASGGRVGFEKGGPGDKKKTTPALDKPTIQIDPNAPVDPDRRDFIEKGAGLGALGVGLATGALKFGPDAVKAVKKVPQYLKDDGMPDFFYKVVEAVKQFGEKQKYKTGILKEDDVYTYRNPKTKELVMVEEGPEEVRIEFFSDTGNPSTIGVKKGFTNKKTKEKIPDEYFEQSQIRFPQHGEDYKDIVDEVAGGYDDLPNIVEDIIDID
tara:strand:+ start:1654 stop:4542 length:2889 start_codon:yes stop_codon:yes gene_type:complete